MDDDVTFERIKAVQVDYVDSLMELANVIGVAIGYRKCEGKLTDEPALVVMVDFKVPIEDLDEKDIIPSEIEGVTVDVQEMGGLFTGGFTIE
jgi:hypothetical protein